MRGHQDFKAFLREKYEAGKALVDHPDPKLREQRKDRDEPRIRFWTAMKYPSFKERVKREFAAWNQQMEQQRPRAEVGRPITNIAGLRRGDFFQGPYRGQRYKVLRFTRGGSAVVTKVDRHGRPFKDATAIFSPAVFRKRPFRLLKELKRDDVSFDDAKNYVDKHLGHPPDDVSTRDKYRGWLDKEFRKDPDSPYYGVDKEEPEHEKRLKEQIGKILEEHGVGEDWRWKSPSRARVGQRVLDIRQLEAGDFVQWGRHNYKVDKIEDDAVKLKRYLDNGREDLFGHRQIDANKLKRDRHDPLIRIDPVVRPKPSFDEFKKFMDEHVGFAPRGQDTRDKYRNWLLSQAHYATDSPYGDLGNDEHEHKRLLENQIDKLLEERGVGASWTWQPPPRVEAGGRVYNFQQLQEGDSFRDNGGVLWKVVSIEDNGDTLRAVQFNMGRPSRRGTFRLYNLRHDKLHRIDPIQRNTVKMSEAFLYANDYANDSGREVKGYDDYREWLIDIFTKGFAKSPYYALGDDEDAHQKTFKQHIDSILKDRGIGKDWKWKAPPLVELPANTDWERVHDAVRRAVLEGEVVHHPGAPKGKLDKHLGGGIGDADIRRMRDPSGKERDYVFKQKAKERGDVRIGTPTGTLHLREGAAYGIDRLLGEGTIVPPSLSDGTGSYQEVVKAKDWQAQWSPLGVSTAKLIEHPDVQRLLFFDDLIGHEDRHYKNVMFSWKDPQGPKTADNLQLHAIDNGFSLAGFDDKNSPQDMILQRESILPFKSTVYEKVLRKMSPELHKKIKALKIEDVLRNMVETGLKDKSGLRALAVRLRSMQDNPEVLGPFITKAKASRRTRLAKHQVGRQNWHWLAGKDPEKLFRDHTSLPPKETMQQIDRQIEDALAAAKTP